MGASINRQCMGTGHYHLSDGELIHMAHYLIFSQKGGIMA